MPVYVYGCSKNREHPRVEVAHGYFDNPEMRCSECGGILHRIPQKSIWGVNPLQIIIETSERNWTKKLRKEPRDYNYDHATLNRGLPQRNFKFRK